MDQWISIKDAAKIAAEYSTEGSIRYAVGKGLIPSKREGYRIFVSRAWFDLEKEFIRYCSGEREWGADLENDPA